MTQEVIVGIDLGTTNSEVAIIEDGRPLVIGQGDETLLPSVVGLGADGTLLVGAPAQNQALLAPERTIRSVKRRMGEDVRLSLGDQSFAPQEISAMILRTLKARAEAHVGGPVGKAVITVPAYFNDAQRQATRDAGELAGLEVVRIVNEPTAAALVYEAGQTKAETILVYDLGGGTFDVSIVRIESGVIEVVASHGDTHLGGDDFDQLLCDHVAERFDKEHGVDLRDDVKSRASLQRAVEAAKVTLSSEPFARLDEEFIATKDGQPLHLSMELQRHEYEALIRPLVERTMESVQTALSDAKLVVGDLDRIVLAGGATRTPLVRQALLDRTHMEPCLDMHPDLCVAMGAAIQAGIIAGEDVGAVLVDVSPYTFGIQCIGPIDGVDNVHFFSPIIHRNTALPASQTEVYYTHYDEQEVVQLTVFQGEEPDVRGNTEIGDFRIEGLSRAPANNEVLCRLDLDLNGMLKVTAIEKRTGLAKDIVIDNAISRFEAEEMAAASQRLGAMFGEEQATATPGTGVPDGKREELMSVLRRAGAVERDLPRKMWRPSAG